MPRKEWMVEYRRMGKVPRYRHFGTDPAVRRFLQKLAKGWTGTERFPPIDSVIVKARDVGPWRDMYCLELDSEVGKIKPKYIRQRHSISSMDSNNERINASTWGRILKYCEEQGGVLTSQRQIAAAIGVNQSTVSRTIAEHQKEWNALWS